MEIPILDMIFRIPLSQAVMKFSRTRSEPRSVGIPNRWEAARSSTASKATYGQTAAAPYPTSRAMWCTSRASPLSTTIPTWVRVFSLIRWWWTAAVASRDGMGARAGSSPRSEITRMLTPLAMAAEAPVRRLFRAVVRPALPSATA